MGWEARAQSHVHRTIMQVRLKSLYFEVFLHTLLHTFVKYITYICLHTFVTKNVLEMLEMLEMYKNVNTIYSSSKNPSSFSLHTGRAMKCDHVTINSHSTFSKPNIKSLFYAKS